MPRQPSAKQRAIQARNQRNAQHATGLRTTAGKARSAMNALTHGLRALTPRDEAEVLDREQRLAVLIETFQPSDGFEEALIHRMAAAFQRLEKADHFESQVFEHSLVFSKPPTPGRLLTEDKRVQTGFSAVNRYRATAQHDLFNAYRMLEVYRQRRDDDATPVLPNEAKTSIIRG